MATKVDVLLGLQWGDEGKGKIVDVLCPQYDLIARYQGGPNAGHTLEFNDKKFVLNTLPSGIFHSSVMNLIGNGVVIDPILLKSELDSLGVTGYDPVSAGKLVISRKAHLILPSHQLLDALNEEKLGSSKIGSTVKGIGPAYMDKSGRNGVRIGDIHFPDFNEKYRKLVSRHKKLLSQYDSNFDLSDKEDAFFEAVEFLKTIPLVDSEYFVNAYLKEGKSVLAEGAQGTLLDIDFGSYPFVTSSNTTTAGACIGLGVSPDKIGKVIGIFKAYATRVGNGPFPTELFDQNGEILREIGREYGAVSGRSRRCGWIDLPALKYALMINGVTEMVMTKADVLAGFDTIFVCTQYRHEGAITDSLPYNIVSDLPEPLYQSVSGWNKNITDIVHTSDIPDQLSAYIDFLETELETPITFLSVGPDRKQTIRLKQG